MSFKHGSLAELWLAGADVSEYFNAMDFMADVATAESTTFKKTWKTHIPGVASSTLDTGGLYDPTMSDVRATLGVSAGTVITAGPAGLEAVGDLARLVSVLTTSYKESAPVGGIVAFTWAVVADGDAGLGVTLHPLASRVSSANGTTHTGPVGGSSNGAVAHLHVTSASAADSLTVEVEHSTNGTDWTELGAFAAATAVGAERIAINGTVNRYLRATWAITGTAPDFTFGVALARL
jgi:hypothetical protein